MIRLLLIRVLLKLLGLPEHRIDEKKITVWLWSAYPQQGFQDYITKRDKQLLQKLGQGVTPEEYTGVLHERIELGLLLSQAKLAYQKMERERQVKRQKAQAVGERKIIRPTKEEKAQ